MRLFLEMGPNRDKGEGLYQCPGLSLWFGEIRIQLNHLFPVLAILGHPHTRKHPEVQRPVQGLKEFTFYNFQCYKTNSLTLL